MQPSILEGDDRAFDRFLESDGYDRLFGDQLALVKEAFAAGYQAAREEESQHRLLFLSQQRRRVTP